MNDSKEFQDAESNRSGNSHVTSRPVSFPPHPIPEGMLSRSIGMSSRREGPSSILGHTWYIGKCFCKLRCVIISTLSSRIESMEFQDQTKNRFTHQRWKRVRRQTQDQDQRCQSGPSAKNFSHLQWRRLSKELWSRPTTTADFGSSFRQIPYTSHVCLLEDKIQD